VVELAIHICLKHKRPLRIAGSSPAPGTKLNLSLTSFSWYKEDTEEYPLVTLAISSTSKPNFKGVIWTTTTSI
jgi:hypothetical protein